MFNLLADANNQSSTWVLIAIVAVMIVLLIVFGVLNSRRRKKQEKDAQDLINAVKPGNKVKTIGGICGIVVEVDEEENTFVLETGTEQSGKSYIKFDRQAIYQTDAVVPTATPEKDEPFENDAATEQNVSSEGAEEKPAEQTAQAEAQPADEKPEEKPEVKPEEKPHHGKKKGAKAAEEQNVEPFEDVKEQK